MCSAACTDCDGVIKRSYALEVMAQLQPAPLTLAPKSTSHPLRGLDRMAAGLQLFWRCSVRIRGGAASGGGGGCPACLQRRGGIGGTEPGYHQVRSDVFRLQPSAACEFKVDLWFLFLCWLSEWRIPVVLSHGAFCPFTSLPSFVFFLRAMKFQTTRSERSKEGGRASEAHGRYRCFVAELVEGKRCDEDTHDWTDSAAASKTDSTKPGRSYVTTSMAFT